MFISITINAQSSFQVLEQAEKYYNAKLYNKALMKTTEAQNIKDCTCGNCSLQKNRRITLLRYNIYVNTKKIELGIQSLDCAFSLSNYTIDSLKIRLYQHKIGRKKLSKQIDISLQKIRIECDQDECYLFLPLKKDVIKLKMGIEYMFISTQEKKIIKWKEYFLESSIYKTIVNL